MKVRKIFGISCAAASLLALSTIVLASCAKKTAQNTLPADALVIKKQGVFASGGTVTAPVAGDYAPEKTWLDPTRAGGINAWGEDGKSYMPGDQAWYTHFRIGLVAPDRYEGSAFPAGSEAQNQFFRQMTPNTGDYDEKLFGSVLSEVLSDVRKMTGKKAIYITHSQGGRVGWQTDTENLAAIVAVEPGGTPVVGSDEYNKFLAAKIPMIIYFGDYIDNGPTDIMSTGFWKNVRDTAIDFAEHYNADGGDATVIDLPKIGIKGNSHFLFQEMNNAEIAEHLESWLRERGFAE